MRRILKTPSNTSITDELLIDYINRFYINDVDARLQLFDLKTTYTFMTQPGVDQYNMPLYSFESTDQGNDIRSYPVYQGFLDPCYINGVAVPLYTQRNSFFNIYPNVVQNFQGIAQGNDGNFFNFQIPILSPSTQPQNPPFNAILRGHIDTSGIIYIGDNDAQDPPLMSISSIPNNSSNINIPVTSMKPAVYISTIDNSGNNMVMTDSGIFFEENVNEGLLITPGNPPLGNKYANSGYSSEADIVGITLGNPTVVQLAVPVFFEGQSVLLDEIVGTTELNGNTYLITAVNGFFISLDVDSTSFTPYVSDGVASTISQNFVNYLTGEVNVIFPFFVPAGNNINVQVNFFEGGLPRAILFYDNVLTLRSPPAQQYLVELAAYLTPAAFLSSSQALPFGYMSEYIARGAARKILSDTGDIEQFNFYEPFFREQEMLVWKRSQRQWTATRTPTIYSQGFGQQAAFNNLGGGTI
jgi:hypothetical protein